MGKIFNGEYTRLDDDVSMQLVRTNPALTTNTKLIYDGENMYLESYDADTLLTQQKYKNVKIHGGSPFNKDIRNFLLGTGDVAYSVFQNNSNVEICDTFDNQFENMYWCGAESINSKRYDQELGFIAPLYLRKKHPNYFVIFKIDGPSNYNLNLDESGNIIDNSFNFNDDIISKARIIKSFDLREGTVIGNYIKKYTEQKEFEYDKSIYVNFSTKEITYYGIDKKEGVLTTKKENFEDELLKNDNTILHSDDWITSGFYRNGLIFPYIINLEFLFDDNDTDDFKFARYFGIYCNDIDMFSFEAKYNIGDVIVENPEKLITETIVKKTDERNIGLIFSSKEDLASFTFDRNDRTSVYYVKDKYNNLHGVEDVYKNYYDDDSDTSEDDSRIIDLSDKVFDLESVCGFNTDSVSAHCERLNEIGTPEFSFTINENFRQGEEIHFYSDFLNDSDEEDNFANFVAVVDDDTLPEGTFRKKKFSARGTLEDVAKALCGAINALNDDIHYFNAYYKNNVVVIKSIFMIENINEYFRIKCDDELILNKRITINGTQELSGLCDNSKSTFKVYSDDLAMFSTDRYLRSNNGKKSNSRIVSCVPYVSVDGDIESDYYELVTDENGEFVSVSNTNMVEIIDRFYPKFGILSFFPVVDFDFDTVFSNYGSDEPFKNECKRLEEKSKINEDDDSDSDSDSDIFQRKSIETLANGYLFDDSGRALDNEYEYFMENLIAELSTKSKVSPYISKWGYYDDSKDSCENVYRLNMSKIFGTSNLSANTFTDRYSITEHTHSMPYYVTSNKDVCKDGNEYQYIYCSDIYEKLATDLISSTATEYDIFVNNCVEYFSDTTVDHFDDIVYTKSDENKRFTKKYSRFKFGNGTNNASTMFRGVKFNCIKQVGGSDVFSNEYNDYRFTFLYIPVELSSIYFNDTVYFVKNDKFKYIIGFVIINTMSDTFSTEYYIEKYYNNDDFCKAYMYGGCYGLLKLPIADVYGDIDESDSEYIEYITLENIPMKSLTSLKEDKYGYIDINKMPINNSSIQMILRNLNTETPIERIFIHNISGSIRISFCDILYKNGFITVGNGINTTDVYEGGENLLVDITFINKYDKDGNSLIFKNFFSVYETVSAYYIKKNIDGDYLLNDGVTNTNVRYYSTSDDTYRMSIENPISVNTYDTFTCNPLVVEGSGTDFPICSSVGLKNDLNELKLKTINRYSGYYNPIFNDILVFDDMNNEKLYKYSNTKFDTDFSDNFRTFGNINNLWFHKVNESNPNEIISMENPYYPLIGQFALDYRDYNIFESSWDKDHFTTQVSISEKEKCAGTSGMMNGLAMFGSKYINVPNEITIETFNGINSWDDDFISDSSLTNYDIMINEVGDTVVNFYLFIHDRIIRYFIEESGLKDEFLKYVNPIYSYGDKTTLNDDMKAYIEKNILKLYELDNIKLWIKRAKVGSYDKDINNDYATYLVYDNNSKISKNLQKESSFTLKKLTSDKFDRKLIYYLRKGYKESFGFSFTIKKI